MAIYEMMIFTQLDKSNLVCRRAARVVPMPAESRIAAVCSAGSQSGLHPSAVPALAPTMCLHHGSPTGTSRPVENCQQGADALLLERIAQVFRLTSFLRADAQLGAVGRFMGFDVVSRTG